MTTKFTPGPWVLQRNGYKMYSGQIFQEHKALRGKSALHYGPVASVQHEDNANLIAAAPEMYEALLLCRDYILTSDNNFADKSTAYLRAMAAIAKAEGGAQ